MVVALRADSNMPKDEILEKTATRVFGDVEKCYKEEGSFSPTVFLDFEWVMTPSGKNSLEEGYTGKNPGITVPLVSEELNDARSHVVEYLGAAAAMLEHLKMVGKPTFITMANEAEVPGKQVLMVATCSPKGTLQLQTRELLKSVDMKDVGSMAIKSTLSEKSESDILDHGVRTLDDDDHTVFDHYWDGYGRMKDQLAEDPSSAPPELKEKSKDNIAAIFETTINAAIITALQGHKDSKDDDPHHG